jgi:uncharacterized coiled-coil DUF342 family protein
MENSMRTRAITERLIDDPQVVDKLKLVDAYIIQLHKLGRQFILPHEHAELKPLVEAYANDLPKFVAYIKAIRDAVPQRGNTYIALHELYRTLNVRQVQQERRARAGKAWEWLERKHPKLDYEQKTRWLRKLEQQWGRERLAYMDDIRRKLDKPRLTTEEREEVLDEFWREIDAGIKRGELPSP